MSEIETSVFVTDIHGGRHAHPAADFIAGIFGGCAGVFAGHPLDTIKVRLQNARNQGIKYNNTWHCFIKIVKEERVFGLYKGLTSPIVGVAAINSLLFGVYGWCLRRVSNSPDPSVLAMFVAGSTSGFVNSFFSCPMELIKIRLQNQVSTVSQGHPFYNGTWDCIRKIYKTTGVKGYFRGFHATVWRDTPSYGLYFASYELLSRFMVPPGTNMDVPSPMLLFAGGIAGVLAWLVTYPFDVAKTRLQSVSEEVKPQYKGLFNTLNTIRHVEGGKTLFTGMTATAIRAFPTNAATFYAVVYVKNLINGTMN